MSVKPIPDGYHTATPYLIVDDADAAIKFYGAAFGATELLRMPTPDGRIGHAEIQLGTSRIMLSDEYVEMGYRSPKSLGGTPVPLFMYVEDVDAVFAQAIDAGGTEQRPVEDQFYGDRSGTLEDPFGHVWTISTHKEDLTPEEIAERIPQDGH